MSDAVQKPTKVSREGIVLIKSFEGFRARAVQRGDGRWVIGYGHTLSAREGLTVSEPDAELLLQYDLIPVVKAVGEVQPPLNQHQFDALASFAFSIGADRFRTSDVLARLNAGAPAEAADALIAWTDESAAELPPRRRAAERALFFAAPGTPVALADLLAAPLPPPPIEAEPEIVKAEEVEEEEAAPFPAEPVEDALEPDEEDFASESSDLTEEAAVPVASIQEAPPTQPTRQQGWPAAGTGAFHLYSPYALQAIGPLPGFGATPTRPNAASEPQVSEKPETVADDPTPEAVLEIAPEEVEATEETLEVAEEPIQPDLVAANDMEASSETIAVETAPEPPVIEHAAETSSPVEPVAMPAPAPQPIAPINTPVFASPFPPIEPPTLVLTSPSLVEIAPAERIVWPEAARGDEADQNPLFEAEAAPAPNLDLSVRYDAETQPPRRFDWSETGTFLIMGGIGLVSFGAAMAAFRRAGETDGDTALIGWVLAVIALACVGVSGFNLYQRWGRADRD